MNVQKSRKTEASNYKTTLMVVIKYLLSSGSSFLIDMGLFAVLNGLVFTSMPDRVNITVSTIAARVVSSLWNFSINRKVVFQTQEGLAKTMAAYYTLAVVQMGCSAGLVNLFTEVLSFPTVIVKLFADGCLFVISFFIQKKLIFKK